MSVGYQTGFDHYGGDTALMLQDAWTEVDANITLAVPAVGANTGPLSMRVGPSGAGSKQALLPITAAPQKIASFWIFAEALPTDDTTTNLIVFETAAEVVVGKVRLNADGKVRLLDSGGVEQAITAAPVIEAGKWQHVAVRILQAGANGAFELRVDGIGVLLDSTVNVGSTDIGHVAFFPESAMASVLYIDDLVINGVTGTYNFDFPGKARVATLLAVGDGPDLEWATNTRSKFGAAAMQFRGNGGFSVWPSAGIDLGTDDFTIETFAKFLATPTSSFDIIISRWREATEARVFRFVLGSSAFNGGALAFQKSVAGTPVTVVSEVFAPMLEKWYHLCVQRNSGSVRMFIDGVLVDGPAADISDYAGLGTLLTSGAQQDGSSSLLSTTGMEGFVDEVRITKGLARYATGGFAPPTAPHPRTVAGDPDIGKVVLLAGFDEAAVDESQYRRAITMHGDAGRFAFDDAPPGEYKAVNQIPPRDDTGIETDTNGPLQDFVFARLPGNAVSIVALSIAARVRKLGGGASEYRSVFTDQVGNQLFGVAHLPTNSYAYYRDVFEEDPSPGTQKITTRTFVSSKLSSSANAAPGNVLVSQVVLLVSYTDNVVLNSRFRSWSFNFDKHAFYVMHLGNEGTLIYDAATEQWLDWETSGYTNWNAEHGTEWNGEVYFGDNSLPILWRMDPNSFLDDDFRLITRTATGVLPAAGRDTTDAGIFVLDVTRDVTAADEQSTPFVQLLVSDDGGFSFDEREQIPLEEGERQDFTWRGLGQVKKPGRVYRIVDQGGVATIRGADQRLDDEDEEDDK